MVEQFNLFTPRLFVTDPALARRTDPETSKHAAETLNTAALERVVLEALRERPQGATSEELAEDTGLSLVTISPRLKPLEGKHLVRRDGTRPNRSGRPATVWKAV